MCPNGTGKVGCGPQEEFRGCSDIRITVDGIADGTTKATDTLNPESTSPKPRTRGTVTSRIRRPTTTTPTTTTASSTTGTEQATTSDSSSGHESNPGPYVGIIIALATLLFAILGLVVIIFYFYRCHPFVKESIHRHLHLGKKSQQYAPGNSTSQNSLVRPASVLTLPHSLDGKEFEKPVGEPLPSSRIKRPQSTSTAPFGLRQMTLDGNFFISEPLDVTINGVTVDRQTPGGKVTDSLA